MKVSQYVDPFVGTEPAALPEPGPLAASWFLPKPPIGNTHPGACYPFGMVSACPYSGAYPTGYGRFGRATEGVPRALFDRYRASGFTHFQQSGTGAIRKYYNYVRVTPLVGPLESLGQLFDLSDEHAEPGYYRARLGDVLSELSVGPKVAVHRYTFPACPNAHLVIDFSSGGLALEHARTLPTRADLELAGPGRAQGTIVLEGVPLSVVVQIDSPGFRQSLWYDRRLVGGGTRLTFDNVRETTFRPFGVVFRGPTREGQEVELKIGFSLRGTNQARQNIGLLEQAGFEEFRGRAESAWEGHLSRIQVEGDDEDRKRVFYTALYHSLVKPCFAEDESPFWSHPGPFVFDLCTMWDVYKTQLPLITHLVPGRSVQMVNALLRVREEEGNFPIGYRMSRGADRFFRQASALAHTLLADVQALGLAGIDWEWALGHMHADLLRTYGEDFCEKGIVHPVTHTLDLAYGYYCTARVARALGDDELAGRLDTYADYWKHAYDPSTGLLKPSTYYEGTAKNYSFRLLHDMRSRISLGGGDAAFVQSLDDFFGFGAAPAHRLGVGPSQAEIDRGYALGRFEGLNNEPDMEAPYAYHYAGRPDRTARVVHEIIRSMFATGRGGLPGNDDSGGLSSFYVWAAVGLFPVAGQSVFLVSPPAFPEVRLRFPRSELSIVTENFSPEVSFVSRASYRGQSLTRSYLSAREVDSGGSLSLSLSREPSSWGRDERPPSVGG